MDLKYITGSGNSSIMIIVIGLDTGFILHRLNQTVDRFIS